MSIKFLVEVEAKNDGLTQDAGLDVIVVLANSLKDSTQHLPWVLSTEVSIIGHIGEEQ